MAVSNSEKLQALLQPKAATETVSRFSLRIDGQIKSGKTSLALTASAQVPHPTKWNSATPVAVNDILWVGFEENCLMYPMQRGINVANVIDWSRPDLTIADLIPAIKAFPGMAAQWKAAGIKTIVVDTLTRFNSMLVRDIVTNGDHKGDMERIRSYGRVDEMHYLLFDMLRATGMNFIGLVHLEAFQPFGEVGGKGEIGEAMKAAAEKAVDKVESMNAAGMRSDFIPDMRKKPAGHWARLCDGIIVTYAEEKVIRAGEKTVEYKFTQSPDSEFAAGGRWALKGPQEPFLRPHLVKIYGDKV